MIKKQVLAQPRSELISEFPFKDIIHAPKPIREASQAVFRLASGTASFVEYKNRTLVMTNNHVVGLGHCARSGCFVPVVFHYQISKTPRSYYMQLFPIVARDDVDIAFYSYNLWDLSWNKVKHSPKKRLRFAKTMPTAKKKIYLIGHPRSSLKTFSYGEILENRLGHIMIDAFSLPGNSGSPILNSHGNIVGIHHSSIKRNDMFTSTKDILYQGRGSSLPSIIQVLLTAHKYPQREKQRFFHANRLISFKQAKRFSSIYQRSRTIPKLKNQTPFFQALLKDCKKHLNPKTPHHKVYTRSHASCTIAKQWLRCDTQSHQSIDVSARLYYCPQSFKERKQWMEMFQKVASGYKKFVGFDPHLWNVDALLQLLPNKPTPLKAQTKAQTATLHFPKQLPYISLPPYTTHNQQSWQDHLRFSKIYLTMHTHNYPILKKKALHIYKTQALNSLKTYPYKNRNYKFHIPLIAKIAKNLWLAKALSTEDFQALIRQLQLSKHLTLYAKLALDRIEYEGKVLQNKT